MYNTLSLSFRRIWRALRERRLSELSGIAVLWKRKGKGWIQVSRSFFGNVVMKPEVIGEVMAVEVLENKMMMLMGPCV